MLQTTPGYEIVTREDFSDVTYLLEVRHPMLARAAKPGQFVIVMSRPDGERIPLTIADFDRQKGTVTMVVQAVGKTTREMQQHCRAGSRLHALTGPMGEPSHLGDARKVVFIGGGLGVAPVYPQIRAAHEAGVYTVGVIGFRNKDLMFWEDKFRAACDDLIVCTDDGSVGLKGTVVDGLEKAVERHPDLDLAVAIGPPIMMKFASLATKKHKIKTIVSLNPIMVDGTGMCGGCRVRVGDQIKFACVDGPDFDGHLVDFDDMMKRLRRFNEQEKTALERWSETCRMTD